VPTLNYSCSGELYACAFAIFEARICSIGLRMPCIYVCLWIHNSHNRYAHVQTCACARAHTHTHTCGSVKRLEHEREVKQLQKIEQLDNRIKELEAELAKRKQIEQLHYRVKEQLEQLHNRVQELEAELTQRADEVLKEQLRVIVCLASLKDL